MLGFEPVPLEGWQIFLTSDSSLHHFMVDFHFRKTITDEGEAFTLENIRFVIAI